jgi:2-oxoglutarate ferredoxin oxidoreductase subunit beta
MSTDVIPASLNAGLSGVPLTASPLTRVDFTAPGEVRWCPGCGDYTILATMLGVLPELGIKRENVVIVSGIGCSSRFPYYVNSYGFHSIHGRAPAVATGIAMARPDLSVWVITGDGDALSIGGNHLIHALRRNVNLNIVLFNNRIYGLTKGQASPTSELGKVTISTPAGLIDQPFNPISLALGAQGTFVARSADWARPHLAEVLAAAAHHRGTSFVEVYQNCHIFNDGAFDALKGRDSGMIPLRHGQPIVFGENDSRCVVRGPDGSLQVALVADVGLEAAMVHDRYAARSWNAYQLAGLTDLGVTSQAPMGVFRQVERNVYDDQTRAQVSLADDQATRLDNLHKLFTGADHWIVTAPMEE